VAPDRESPTLPAATAPSEEVAALVQGGSGGELEQLLFRVEQIRRAMSGWEQQMQMSQASEWHEQADQALLPEQRQGEARSEP
jgi:hypothetical protein